jgi:Cys-rich repeat protein
MNSFLRVDVVAVSLVLLAVSGCSRPGARCQASSDCSEEGRTVCSPELLRCVECVTDEHCGVGQTCIGGLCGPGCRDERGACELGQYCKPGAACVECVTDAHCGPGRLCRADACVPGCSAQHPVCPSGLTCDASAGRCVQCTTNAQCTTPGLPICNPATNTCVGCASNGDCTAPGAPVCNPATNTCVACVSDPECPRGQVCRQNACVPGCSPNQPCLSGQVCSPGGQCVQCTSDAQCGGATPRCDLASNRCVACLPGAADTCPMGQYCRADFTCERGCKTGVDCPSGVCRSDRSCASCTQDSHCAAGNVCINGSCTAACSATNPCGSGRDCCDGRCVDSRSDVANCGACGTTCGAGGACCQGVCRALDTVTNCGACGVACGANAACCAGACTPTNSLTNCGGCNVRCGVDQFCDGTVCRNQTFPEFCANRSVFAIYDGRPLDDAATNVLASTIRNHCSTQTVIQYGPQTNAAWVDQANGALRLGGGSTVVTAGGPFPNRPVQWLERTRQATKVFFASNGVDTFYFRRRSDNSNVVAFPQASCSSSRDVFLVHLVTDPASGTLVLLSYGLCSGGFGTQTGAWYWANVMLPNRQSYPDSWYVYEWLDTNSNTLPDLSDTFTLRGSGR